MRAPNASSSIGLLVGVSLAIAASPCIARDPGVSEAQMAKELFERIAEQSGCPSYAVSWLDSLRGALRTQCADSLTHSNAVAADLPPQVTRFIVDVGALKTVAPASGQRLGWASNVLAYKLSRFQRVLDGTFASRAPVIIFGQVCCGPENTARSGSSGWLIRADETLR
jgi:hypothetical protein